MLPNSSTRRTYAKSVCTSCKCLAFVCSILATTLPPDPIHKYVSAQRVCCKPCLIARLVFLKGWLGDAITLRATTQTNVHFCYIFLYLLFFTSATCLHFCSHPPPRAHQHTLPTKRYGSRDQHQHHRNSYVMLTSHKTLNLYCSRQRKEMSQDLLFHITHLIATFTSCLFFILSITSHIAVVDFDGADYTFSLLLKSRRDTLPLRDAYAFQQPGHLHSTADQSTFAPTTGSDVASAAYSFKSPSVPVLSSPSMASANYRRASRRVSPL